MYPIHFYSSSSDRPRASSHLTHPQTATNYFVDAPSMRNVHGVSHGVFSNLTRPYGVGSSQNSFPQVVRGSAQPIHVYPIPYSQPSAPPLSITRQYSVVPPPPIPGKERASQIADLAIVRSFQQLIHIIKFL